MNPYVMIARFLSCELLPKLLHFDSAPLFVTYLYGVVFSVCVCSVIIYKRRALVLKCFSFMKPKFKEIKKLFRKHFVPLVSI